MDRLVRFIVDTLRGLFDMFIGLVMMVLAVAFVFGCVAAASMVIAGMLKIGYFIFK